MAPTLTCCGHDHDHDGIASGVSVGCLAINAAQKGILRLDDRSGGCEWLVDVVSLNIAKGSCHDAALPAHDGIGGAAKALCLSLSPQWKKARAA